MRARFSFLSTSICFSFSFLTLPTRRAPRLALLPPSPPLYSLPLPFPPRSAALFPPRPFVSTSTCSIAVLFLLNLSPLLRPFVFLLPFLRRGSFHGKKTAPTMASCLPFYGTLSLSVRVCQINLHSLVDRINALLTFTRFLGKRRLNYSRSRATGYPRKIHVLCRVRIHR